jgi:hypothetical protein
MPGCHILKGADEDGGSPSPQLTRNRPAIGSLPPFNSRRPFAILGPSSQFIITHTERECLMTRKLRKTSARLVRQLRREHLVELILGAVLLAFIASSTTTMARPKRNDIQSFAPALVDGAR